MKISNSEFSTIRWDTNNNNKILSQAQGTMQNRGQKKYESEDGEAYQAVLRT